MTFLKTNKYQVITLSEAIRKLLSIQEKGRFIVITVDDAFNSFLSNGFPLLKEFGFRATLFVNTETIGNSDYLNWEELQYLVDQGIEIGNHTHSHNYFLNVNQTDRPQVFFKDVDIAQKLIKERLNIQPSVFSFPYGEYDIQMKNMIKDMDFIGAAAQNSGVISSYSDLYALPRFPMTDMYGKMPAFKEKISMKALPVIKTIPESTIAQQNPPVLEITLDKGDLDYSRLQCFIQGGGCKVTPIDDGNISFRIISTQPLTSRRHLYTITVPNKANTSWYWFSFQWVFPGIR
jgi:peptidoglycan/xylan/chitin deacetylase (PgdA/CDA1 family)